MARYLVVGGDGFVGSNLVQALRFCGHKVDVTTRRSDTCDIQFDLRDDDVASVLPSKEYRAVFLTAAISNMEKCEADPSDAYAVNVVATSRIGEWAKERGIWISFLSSSQVYDGEVARPAEDENIGPKNVYGAQKLQAEQFLASLTPNLTIIRPSKIIGGLQGIFASWQSSLQANEEIVAASNIYLSPVSVSQVVATLLYTENARVAGCFNMSASDQFSYYQAAELLAECVGISAAKVGSEIISSSKVPEKFRPAQTVLNCSAIGKYLEQEMPSTESVLREAFCSK